MRVPERHRIKTGLMASDSSYGNNGAFTIPHDRISGYFYNVIASDGEGWQHVSVTLMFLKGKRLWRDSGRCPTWDEMCFIKSLFWDDEETVIQFHPPKSEYVNNHPNCLHLWKPDNFEIPLPDSLMIGYK